MDKWQETLLCVIVGVVATIIPIALLVVAPLYFIGILLCVFGLCAAYFLGASILIALGVIDKADAISVEDANLASDDIARDER